MKNLYTKQFTVSFNCAVTLETDATSLEEADGKFTSLDFHNFLKGYLNETSGPFRDGYIYPQLNIRVLENTDIPSLFQPAFIW